MARWVVAGLALLLPLLSACGKDVEELLPQAKCDDKVWQSQKDSRAVVGLLPDGTESLDVRFHEIRELYDGQCVIVSDGSEVLRAQAWYDARGKTDLGKAPDESFMSAHDMDGPPRRITSSPQLRSVSGVGSAALSAPCSYERMGKGRLLKDGELNVTVVAGDAPEAAGSEQRQRAADLALSFLRYAAEKCDEPPTLPKKVRVAG